MMRRGVMRTPFLVGVILTAGATTLSSQPDGRAATARVSAARPVTAASGLADLRALAGMPYGSLSGVSASSGRNAWAVGADGSAPLVEHWNGRRWKQVPSGPDQVAVRLPVA
jgi:hypothetical protein